MIGQSNECHTNRRRYIRLAGEGALHAAVVDDNGQPLIVLREVEIINVSAGGLCVLTPTSVAPASHVSAIVGQERNAEAEHRKIRLECLECTQQHDKRYRVRFRLLEGAMPAQVIYQWYANQGRPVPA